jgi:hypothetical protein
MATITLRERLNLDSNPWLSHSVIRFRHPGYPNEFSDALFRLHCFDDSGGLHHATAWLACAIVAGNEWEGYLSSDRLSGQRLAASMDEVLTESDYWFHIPNCSSPYPVVPSFQNWQFPHHNLPPGWGHLPAPKDSVPQASLNTSFAIRVRDQSCRITQCRDCTDAAHLCPCSEHAWFNLNDMGAYNADQVLAGTACTNDMKCWLLSAQRRRK